MHISKTNIKMAKKPVDLKSSLLNISENVCMPYTPFRTRNALWDRKGAKMTTWRTADDLTLNFNFIKFQIAKLIPKLLGCWRIVDAIDHIQTDDEFNTGGDHCCVFGCNNDRRTPELYM